jgi:acyl-CoA synthetase (AMP-forming)/AMP-acid ligase II
VVENLYGPTELTITCSGYRLPAERDRWPETSNGTVPIGQVLPHLDGVLLDEDGAATDDGELCVRGGQRFSGYLDPRDDAGRFVRYERGRAVVTAESPLPGDWYRTGDRVRLEHGEWVHSGRLDDQVKIHGYRIELGEIESVLRGHPAVHDVVVLALPAGKDSIGLYALYTGEPVEAADLAALVSRKLPPYMLPERFAYVDHLPTNTSGKIDRRRIAAETDLAGGG